MAYPMAGFPTFAVFRDRLGKKGCEFKKLPTQVTDPHGKCHDIYYFERKAGGKTYIAVVDYKSDDEQIVFSVIRSICARLRIKPRDLDIGLDLG